MVPEPPAMVRQILTMSSVIVQEVHATVGIRGAALPAGGRDDGCCSDEVRKELLDTRRRDGTRSPSSELLRDDLWVNCHSGSRDLGQKPVARCLTVRSRTGSPWTILADRGGNARSPSRGAIRGGSQAWRPGRRQRPRLPCSWTEQAGEIRRGRCRCAAPLLKPPCGWAHRIVRIAKGARSGHEGAGGAPEGGQIGWPSTGCIALLSPAMRTSRR